MRVFLKSFGCSANTADTEVMAGCLAQAGFTIETSEAEADLLIYNTCAVKGPTENRIIDALKRAPDGKKLIVAGCLPIISFNRLAREVNFDGAIGPSSGKEIVEFANRVISGEKVIDVANLERKPDLVLPRIKSNPMVSVVPINYGCLGSCAYCCVVHARGHLRSYNVEEVTRRVRSDVAAGAKEIWLTSQDTACYGRDLHSTLAELLSALDGVQGDFHVRVGMMTPNIVANMRDPLIEAFQSPKVFKFLHLPVQSGDDETLGRMRRFYTAAEFESIVEAFRLKFPDLTLATDIIVGFPGETEAAFERTLDLLEIVRPDVTNVSKFFARPKTAAALMQTGLVERNEIKRRSTVASELVKQVSLGQNTRWIGWTGEVLIDEKGKIEGSWVGRNFAYKPIAIKNKGSLLGKTVRLKVVEASTTFLKGELI